MEYKYIDEHLIMSFFEALNGSGVKYVLLRNTGGELPAQLRDGKDIDILVCHEDIDEFMRFMEQENFQKKIHPVGKLAGWKLAYQMHDFLFYKKRKSPYKFYVDVSQELCCHSVMPNVWIPLDRKIQEDAWQYRRYDHEKGWWCLDERTELIMYLVRAVLDKQQFSSGYVENIKLRCYLLDDVTTRERLKLVFFKYTDRLTEMLKKEEYDKIITNYYKFKDY
ncbi:MAG: hypothetical protein NC305_08480 [Lachnospiraceae bacterium]|nr:hypothetical protein [Butyrivibrio sp.]MCM1343399.1 hypothetical protein [Muribaculaceae bacterium]MCM1410568.1 hypothetical protein [Lachnospiraceae bacterium]